MAEITSYEKLVEWLSLHTNDARSAIAVRASLRVLPMLDNAQMSDGSDSLANIILPYFRGISAQWSMARFSFGGYALNLNKINILHELSSQNPSSTGDGDLLFAGLVGSFNSFDSRLIDDFRTRGLFNAINRSLEVLMNSPDLIGSRRRENLEFEFFLQISRDARLIESEGVLALLSSKLFNDDAFYWLWREKWQKLKGRLERQNEDWHVWTDWYEDRLHGRPANEALELARVLEITEEEWNAGPRVVNAKIARLIEEHTPKRPLLPAALPSPVSFQMRGGALHRAPPEEPAPPPERRAGAEAAWRALGELFEDLRQGAGGNDPQLGKALARCRAAMGAAFPALDVVMLGIHADRVHAFAARADEMLMPGDAGELVALSAQLALFLAQFPEWAAYAEGIGTPQASPEAEQAAAAAAADAIAAVEDAAPGLIAPDAAAPLGDLKDAALPAPTPDDPAPVAPPVPRRSFLRAVRALFLKLAATALAPVRSGIAKGVEKAVEKQTEATASAAISYVAAQLAAIAALIPGEWAWIVPVLVYLQRLRGP